MKLADLESRIKIEKSMLYEQNFMKSHAYLIGSVDFDYLISRHDVENQIIMLEQYRNQIYFRLEATHLRMMLKESSFGVDRDISTDGKLATHIRNNKDRLLKIRKDLYTMYGKLPDRKKYQVAKHMTADVEEKSLRPRNGFLRSNRRMAHF